MLSKGFTLVEIMVVVAMIALLAALAIPAFQRVRDNSRENSTRNDLRQIASGAVRYFLENGLTSVAISDIFGIDRHFKSLRTDNTWTSSVVRGEDVTALVPGIGTDL